MNKFDVIVVGTGGVGSAALYEFASRGVRALGLDQFPVAHARGSSHGQSRMIRQAYFEHADYVPLVLRAYELWRKVEQQAEIALLHKIGLVEVGPENGIVVPNVLKSAAEHGLELERWTPKDASQEFGLRIPDDLAVVYETDAGYLEVEACVRTLLMLAERAGATRLQQKVVAWEANGQQAKVTTPNGEFVADRLVFCSGAWSGSLLRELGVPLRILAKHQYWFASQSSPPGARSPAHFFEVPEGYFYGFPEISRNGIKVARHSGGSLHEHPPALDQLSDAQDLQMVREFSAKHLPAVSSALVSQQACMYTMSPDEHFIVDRHPQHANVCLAAGMSGHGFKFTVALGQALAELSLQGSSTLPIDFLSLQRFA